MQNNKLFLVIFLLILHYVKSYFTINLNHTLKSSYVTSNIVFYQYINNDRIIVYQSKGGFWFFDSNFNIVTAFTARVDISSTENLLFMKFYVSQNKLGILTIASNNITCVFNIFTGGQLTFTSNQPIIYAVSMLNSSDYTKLHSIIISQKHFKLYNSLTYLKTLTSYKLSDLNAKLINCSKISLLSTHEITIYCYSTQFHLSKWKFYFPLLSQPILIDYSIQFYNHTCKINKIIIKENLMFIQDQLLQLTVLDLNQNGQKINFNYNMQNSIFFDSFFYDGYYFILTKAQFIKFQYNITNTTFIKIQQAQNNLNQTNFTQFSITFSPYNGALNIGYTKQSLNMFPIYFCPNKQQYNYETKLCSNITCKINNCQTCKLNQNVCNNCMGSSNYSNAKYCDYSCNVQNCQVCSSANNCSYCKVGYVRNNYSMLCQVNNINVPTNIQQQNEPTNPQQNLQLKPQFEIIQNQYNNLDSSFLQFQNVLRHTNSLQSIRSQVDFLSPLFALFDDYWYYIYHKNNLNNLQIIPLFFYFIKKVNQQRLIPEVVDMSSIQLQLKINEHNLDKFQSFTDQKVLLIDQKQTYLMFNLKQFVIQILFFVIIFVLFKGFLIQINKICNKKLQKRQEQQFSKKEGQLTENNNKKSLIDKCFDFIRRKWTIQLLLSIIFQGNLIFTSFQIGLQMKIFFFFNFNSKINLVFLLVMLLSNLLFGLIFYFIFRQKSKCKFIKTSKPLKKVGYKYNNEYLNRALLIGFKNIFIGFFHSFLLDSNKFQLIFIVSIRIIIMLFSFKLQSLYEKQSLKIITIIYILSTIAMDILLLLTSSNFNYINNQQSKNYIFKFQLIIIITLITSTILGVVFQIFYTIQDIKCKNNKIVVDKQIIKKIQPSNNLFNKKQQNKNIISFNNIHDQTNIQREIQNTDTFKSPYFAEQSCIDSDNKKQVKNKQNNIDKKIKSLKRVYSFKSIQALLIKYDNNKKTVHRKNYP